MTNTRRRRVLIAALPLLLAPAAGCGVRPSDVITGDPAPAGPAQGVGLVFVAKDRLTLVLRPTTPPGSVDHALALLLAGPDPWEREQGYTTTVPADIGPATVAQTGPSGAAVTLSGDVAPLSATAVDQIVCTVWNALSKDGPAAAPTTVTLAGPDGSRAPMTCSALGPIATGRADRVPSGQPCCAAPGGEPGEPPASRTTPSPGS